MTLGLFIVDTPAHERVPPADAGDEGGIQLHYVEDGETRGGWWKIDAADNTPTSLVVIDAADAATLEAIGALEGVELWEIL